jgi:hypothetical protein
MAIWQAYLFSSLFRLTVKRRLKGQRDVGRVRQVFRPPPFFVPRSVRVTPAEVGGVSGEWVEASGARGLLLYLHGGGFVAYSAYTHRPITSAFAQSGFRVFSPNYRLAPESPFPAASLDAIKAFLALTGDSTHSVALAGDSAGGGLAVSLMLSLRDKAQIGRAFFYVDRSALQRSIAPLQCQEMRNVARSAGVLGVKVDVLIVGAGFSGLCMAIRLRRKLPELTFLIVEKGYDIGGTWYENRYPCCACDVPSHLYSFFIRKKCRLDPHVCRPNRNSRLSEALRPQV